MRVTCPSCGAAYQLPDAVRPRRLRCAKCANQWVPTFEAPDADAAPAVVDIPSPAVPLPSIADPAPPAAPPAPPAVVPPPEPRLSAEAPLVAERIPARRRRLPAIGWIATAIILIAALAGAFVFRAPIQAAWPPSQRVYGPLGLG